MGGSVSRELVPLALSAGYMCVQFVEMYQTVCALFCM